MNQRQRLAIVLSIFGCLALSSCQRACGKKTLDSEPLKTPPADTLEKSDTPPAVSSFPTLKNLEGLTDAQKTSFTKLLNEEICPCGCPNTFAQCLNVIDSCKPGQVLAEWAMDQLKQGAPEMYLYRAITEELNTGYLADVKKIDTKGAYQKGDPKAPIVIVEFADFECPGCKIAAMEMKSFLEANKDVQIFFMHFPLSIHPHAELAALAAEAAGLQGKFWEMHDLLFKHNGPLTEGAIKELALRLFNTKQFAKFEVDRKSQALLQKIKAHKEYGLNELKLAGTPSFYWNGRPYNLSSSKDGFQLRLTMEKLRSEIKCQK